MQCHQPLASTTSSHDCTYKQLIHRGGSVAGHALLQRQHALCSPTVGLTVELWEQLWSIFTPKSSNKGDAVSSAITENTYWFGSTRHRHCGFHRRRTACRNNRSAAHNNARRHAAAAAGYGGNSRLRTGYRFTATVFPLFPAAENCQNVSFGIQKYDCLRGFQLSPKAPHTLGKVTFLVTCQLKCDQKQYFDESSGPYRSALKAQLHLWRKQRLSLLAFWSQ
jgi:hypothetical protein